MLRLLLILLSSAPLLADVQDIIALEKMDAAKLTQNVGWSVEDHTVRTEDGYPLKLFRLLDPKASHRGRRPPVLIMHGLMTRSEIWVLRGPAHDLAFLLARAGFDVWLGNVRGNYLPDSHTHTRADNHTFWEFSWHEMGVYDVPAMVDYILARAGARQLFYLGHSQGTTIFFAMAASRPEYNSKVRAFLGFAPVVFMSGPYPPLFKELSKYHAQIYSLIKKGRVREYFPRPLRRMTAELCKDHSPLQSFCMDTIFSYMGKDPDQFNSSMLPLIIVLSTGGNPRTIEHYAQNINSGRFQMIDLGSKANLRAYGRSEPPDYNLSRVTAPVALFYGPNDMLSFEKDVKTLARHLPNVIGVFKVPYKHFNHVDFIWAKDSYRLLYKGVIRLMNSLL